MFRELHIQNFKSLADVKTTLGQFTVLVGRNGAGKSSFLQALDLVSWTVRHDSLADALFQRGIDYSDLVFLRSNTTLIRIIANLELTLDGQSPVGARHEVWIKKKRYPYLQTETCDVQGGNTSITQHQKFVRVATEGATRLERDVETQAHSMLRDVYLHPHSRIRFPKLFNVAQHFISYVHYEIWGPDSLRETAMTRSVESPMNGAISLLGAKGQGLPLLLREIRTKSKQGWKQLLSALKQTYPAVAEIRFRQGTKRGEWGIEIVEARNSEGRISFRPAQVSDGMLRLLALLALRYAPEPLMVLGYEEPENGLHPAALDACMHHLKAIAARGTQVIVTTHSPYLLNHLLEDKDEPRAELRLVFRSDDGTTTIAEPDPEKIARAKRQGFGLGELWGMLLDEQELARRAR